MPCHLIFNASSFHIPVQMSHGGAVGLATGCGLDDLGIGVRVQVG
jgi:hypothetical protein